MARMLMKGNEAIAEAAIRAGLQAYFGYPITPQTEILEWMSNRMPALGRVFVQSESELGAINMVYGAACTGVKVMSTSSSPGVSLMAEGLSYIAGTEIPAVLVDVMRAGPGLGNIAPAQADYNQIVHGHGHGDYYPIVLAPSSVQEAIDMTYQAFDLAEKYRAIVIILADGSIGQLMEPAELPPMRPVENKHPEWSVSGAVGREPRRLTSIYLDPPDMETLNVRLLKRYEDIQENEVRYRDYYLDDARFAVISFGSVGRIALSAVRKARQLGIPVGLLRPISLKPFPDKVIEELAQQVDGILVVEMNGGQMLEDVIKTSHEVTRIDFYGRMGGMVPFTEEILGAIKNMLLPVEDMEMHPRHRWFEYISSIVK